MKLIKNIAVVATLASVFAFASCGTTAAAKESAETAKAAVKDAVQDTVNAAVQDTTTAITSTVDAAVEKVESIAQ